MGYGMIGWVVPLDDYPDTYNGQPLAYAGLAAQKNCNSLYFNCVYASKERTELRAAWAAAGKKLDMGKAASASSGRRPGARCDRATKSPRPRSDFIALYEGSPRLIALLSRPRNARRPRPTPLRRSRPR